MLITNWFKKIGTPIPKKYADMWENRNSEDLEGKNILSRFRDFEEEEREDEDRASSIEFIPALTIGIQRLEASRHFFPLTTQTVSSH